jgi:hypothetical protein
LNREFRISQEQICRWLPVSDTNKARRAKTLQDVADDLIKAGYLESYQFDKERKLCTFIYSTNLPEIEIDTEKIAAILVEGKGQVRTNEPALAIESQDQGICSKEDPDIVGEYLDYEQEPDIEGEPREEMQEENLVVQAESAARKLQASLVDAVLWLKSIPFIRENTIQELTSDANFLEKYHAIRAEYERQAGKIQSPIAWLRAAFKAGYCHMKTKKQEQQEENKRKNEELAKIKGMVISAFGSGKTAYAGKDIGFIYDDCGIILANNAGSVPWQAVDLELMGCPGEKPKSSEFQMFEKWVRARFEQGEKQLGVRTLVELTDGGVILSNGDFVSWHICFEGAKHLMDKSSLL